MALFRMTALAIAALFGVGSLASQAPDLPNCTFESCPVCLPEALNASGNLSIPIDGSYHSLPLRIGRCLEYWDTQAMITTLVGILAKEKLGINVEYVHYYDELAAFKSLNNCRGWFADPSTCSNVARGTQEAIEAHAANEKLYPDPAPDMMWAAEFIPATCCNEETYADTDIAWAARDTISTGYVGYQNPWGMYLFRSSEEAAKQDGVTLGYWSAYTTPDAVKYFDSVQTLMDGGRVVPEHEGCTAEPGVVADHMKMLRDLGWTCKKSWWLTPSCAALGDDWTTGCVPFFDDSWTWPKPTQHALMAEKGMRIAMVTLGYDLIWEMLYYQVYKVMFIWWEPDSQFTVHKPIRLGIPFEYERRELKPINNMGWQPVVEATPQLKHLLTNVQVGNPHFHDIVTAIAAAGEEGHAAGQETGPALYQKIACDYLRKHREVWTQWLPDPRSCSAGHFYNAAALACEACPAGTSAKRSATDGIPRCFACPVGTSAKRGAIDCEDCRPGTYSNTAGATSCEECPISKYSAIAKASECKSCPGDFTTMHVSRLSDQECGCAKDSYLENPAGSACGACPEGFTCEGGNTVSSNTVKHNMPVVKEYHYASQSHPYKAFECIEAGSRCLGGMAENCGGGRHGLQCALCDSGKVAGKDKDCEDCSIFQFIAYPVSIVIAMGLLCGLHVVNNTTKGRAFTQMPLFSVVGQIVTQVQMIALMTSYDLKPPAAVEDMLNFLSLFLFDMEALSTSCYFGFSLSAKYAPSVLLPVGVIVFMLLLYIVSRVLRGITGRAMGFNNVVNTLGLVLSALSVAVFKSSLSVLECRVNPSADDTLMNYDGFLCFGDEVLALMPLTMLAFLFFAVGGASTYGYVIVKGPQAFWKSPAFRQRFRFVLSRWHPTWYWWGGLQVVRNLFMCLVPVVSTEGVVQLMLLFAIFTPVFFMAISVRPWREVVANWNDCILSACFVFIVFLSAFFVEEATKGTKTAIGFLLVTGLCTAFTIVGGISIDMIAVVMTGRGLVVKSNAADARLVTLFVETLSKWTKTVESNDQDDAKAEARCFLQQLPQVDAQRLEWFLILMQTGLFAEKPSKRISGISPVAPREADESVFEMKRRLSSSTFPSGDEDEGMKKPASAGSATTAGSVEPSPVYGTSTTAGSEESQEPPPMDQTQESSV